MLFGLPCPSDPCPLHFLVVQGMLHPMCAIIIDFAQCVHGSIFRVTPNCSMSHSICATIIFTAPPVVSLFLNHSGAFLGCFFQQSSSSACTCNDSSSRWNPHLQCLVSQLLNFPLNHLCPWDIYFFFFSSHVFNRLHHVLRTYRRAETKFDSSVVPFSSQVTTSDLFDIV